MSEFTIKELPEGWKPSDESWAYVKTIAENQKTVQYKPASSIQSASTQRIMEAHARGETLVSYKEPLDPSKYHVRKENGEIDVNERSLTAQEFVNYETMRRGAKNQLGESKLSASTQERKDKAIDAFMFTPPAPLSEIELEKVTRHEQIKEFDKLIIESKKLNWLQRFQKWLFKKEYNDMENKPRFSDEFIKEFSEGFGIKEKHE